MSCKTETQLLYCIASYATTDKETQRRMQFGLEWQTRLWPSREAEKGSRVHKHAAEEGEQRQGSARHTGAANYKLSEKTTDKSGDKNLEDWVVLAPPPPPRAPEGMYRL